MYYTYHNYKYIINEYILSIIAYFDCQLDTMYDLLEGILNEKLSRVTLTVDMPAGGESWA